MNTRQIAYAVTAAINTITKYGAKLPAATQKALNKSIADAHRAVDWRPDVSDSTEAAYAALVAGRDPLTDHTTQQAFLADRLQQQQEAVRDRAGTHLAAAVQDHFDAIVSSFDEAYQQQVAHPIGTAAPVLAAHSITGPDTEPSIVIGSGADATVAWSAIMTAYEAHRKILGAYGTLRVALGVMTSADLAFLYVDPRHADLITVRSLGRSPHPWAVVNADMDLGITTPAGALERQARAAEAMAAEAQRVADGPAQAFRRVHGLGAAGAGWAGDPRPPLPR